MPTRKRDWSDREQMLLLVLLTHPDHPDKETCGKILGDVFWNGEKRSLQSLSGKTTDLRLKIPGIWKSDHWVKAAVRREIEQYQANDPGFDDVMEEAERRMQQEKQESINTVSIAMKDAKALTEVSAAGSRTDTPRVCAHIITEGDPGRGIFRPAL